MSGTTYTPDMLVDLVSRALAASRVSPENAAPVARALVAAEIDGQKGHGLLRVAAYAAQARSGKVDGYAVPRTQVTRAASMMIDVANGFAYPALDLAIAELPKLARQTGIAAAGLVRSHHAGALGLTVERIAAEGLIGLMFSNSPQAMAPWGGRRAVLGTNPIAFAAPRAGHEALVIDLSLTEVARGKIMAASQKGEPIPVGWAKDAEGNPTTDAAVALRGTLTPIAGAKGAALALMVELLTAALTGANLAFQASSFFDADGTPPGIGQLMIAIDPSAFGGEEAFSGRFGMLTDAIAADGTARLPGARKQALREAAYSEGLLVDDQLIAQLRQMAEPPAV